MKANYFLLKTSKRGQLIKFDNPWQSDKSHIYFYIYNYMSIHLSMYLINLFISFVYLSI